MSRQSQTSSRQSGASASGLEVSYSSGGGANLVASGLSGAGGFQSSSYQVTSSSSSGGAIGGGANFVSAAGGASSGSSVTSGSAGAVSQIAQDLLQLSRGSAGSAAGSASGSASFGGASSASFGGASGSLAVTSSGSAGGRASASGGAAGSGEFLSEFEQRIIRSNVPIDVNETEEISVNFLGKQETGLWTNRSEVINWRGDIPITEYLINEDMNPEVITKRSEQRLEYIQEMAIRYLRPPTPPAPGEIIITQEMNSLSMPAPPLVIRQMPARAESPAPLVIREAPPQAPAVVGQKFITISGKKLPPPPRKVIIERLAPLPSKPQSVMVERWLPYAAAKRRVIFQRSKEADPQNVKSRNVIVQWEGAQVVIKKEFKYLGVIRANPVEYVQKYGAELVVSSALPEFVHEFKTPADVGVLAADYKWDGVYELEGDVKAMAFVNLQKESLTEYHALLAKLGISYVGDERLIEMASAYISSQSGSFISGGGASSGSAGASFGASGSASFGSSGSASFGASGSASGSASASGGVTSDIIAQIFRSIDTDNSGSISTDEAASVLLRLNSRLGRAYGENEARAFFKTLDVNKNGQLSLEEFTRAFARLF